MVDETMLRGDGEKAGRAGSTDDPMSHNHAHARTEGADPFADFCRARWAQQPDPVTGLFTGDEAREVFEAGRAHMANELAGPMQAATLLLVEAARVSRYHEERYKGLVAEAMRDGRWAAELGATEAVMEGYAGRAGQAMGDSRNAGALAERIETFLLLDTTPKDTLTGLALSLVQDLDDLFQSSGGVYGLHQNGDGAPWESLLGDGEFGAWLGSYDRLRDALNVLFPGGTADQESADSEAQPRPAPTVEAAHPSVGAAFVNGTLTVTVSTDGMPPDVLSALRASYNG